MSLEDIRPGLKGEVRLVVTEEHSAKHSGSGGVRVLATPQMILLMERAGVAAVDHLLPEGFRTVGAHLNVRHLAPTPIGFEVSAVAEVLEVDGRQIIFRVEAYDRPPGQARSGRGRDRGELVGEGTHRRVIVDMKRFDDKVAEKAARAQPDHQSDL